MGTLKTTPETQVHRALQALLLRCDSTLATMDPESTDEAELLQKLRTEIEAATREADPLQRELLAGSAAASTDVTDAVQEVMAQAQVFASSWSLVGGQFDAGNMLETAQDEKATLQSMVTSLATLADMATQSAAGIRFEGVDDTLEVMREKAAVRHLPCLDLDGVRYVGAGDGVSCTTPPKALDDPRLQQLFGDCIEGALTMGYQGTKPPPEGHWLWRFWSEGRAVALKESQAAPEQPDRLAAAAVVAMLFSEHEEALPEDLVEQARTAFKQSGLDIDDDSQEAAMEVRVLTLLRGLLAQPAAVPAAR